MATKVKSDDVTWIPRGKALAIPDTQEEEQHAVEERLMDKIKYAYCNQFSYLAVFYFLH